MRAMARFARALLLAVLALSASAIAPPTAGTHLRGGAEDLQPKPVPASEEPSRLRKAARTVVAKVMALARWRGGLPPAEDDLARAAEIKGVGEREAKADEIPTHPEEAFVVGKSDVLLGSSIWILLAILVAIYHNKTKVMPTASEFSATDLDGGWKFGFWDCCADPSLCLLSWCCPAVRWGDTMRMAGLLTPFGLAFAVFLGLHVLSSMFGMLLAFILAMVGAKYRQGIRQLFDNNPGTTETWALDCLAYCCCPCVAIVQEARTIEAAWGSNHPKLKQAREEWEKASTQSGN